MTFLEEFKLRIQLAGGRRKLADEIECEWLKTGRSKLTRTPTQYSEDDLVYLKKLIQKTAKTLGRSEMSIAVKLLDLAFKKTK